MLELVYTASDKGLLSGRSGFTTVAMTDGFPQNLISPIENLSGYTNLYAPESPEAELNPANYSYQHYNSGGSLYHVISRISYAGFSFTGRCNNLAHHLIFSTQELQVLGGNTVGIVASDNNFPPYTPPAHLLPIREKPHLAQLTASSGWQRLCGNALWAKVIAERFRADKSRCTVLQFSPKDYTAKDLLPLVAEVAALLKPEELTEFTFSTYCYRSTIGNPIYLRAYPEGSPFLESVKRLNPQSVIVVGQNNQLTADDEKLLERASEREAMAALEAQRAIRLEQPENSIRIPIETKPCNAPVQQATFPAVENHVPAMQVKSEPIVASQDTKPSRWPLWIIAGVLFIGIMSFAFWQFLSRNNEIVVKKPMKVATADTPAAADAPKTSATQAHGDAQSPKETENKPVETDEKATVPENAPEKPAEPAPVIVPQPQSKPAVLRELTAAERLENYILLKKKQSHELPLPEKVSPQATVKVTMTHLGNVPVSELDSVLELNKGLFTGKGECAVPALSSNKNEMGKNIYQINKETLLCFQIAEDGKKLKIIVPVSEKGVLLPQLEHVSAISIDDRIVYQDNLEDDFLPLLEADVTKDEKPVMNGRNELEWQIKCGGKIASLTSDVCLSLKVANRDNLDVAMKQDKRQINSAIEFSVFDFSPIVDFLITGRKESLTAIAGIRQNLDELAQKKEELENQAKQNKKEIVDLNEKKKELEQKERELKSDLENKSNKAGSYKIKTKPIVNLQEDIDKLVNEAIALLNSQFNAQEKVLSEDIQKALQKIRYLKEDEPIEDSKEKIVSLYNLLSSLMKKKAKQEEKIEEACADIAKRYEKTLGLLQCLQQKDFLEKNQKLKRAMHDVKQDIKNSSQINNIVEVRKAKEELATCREEMAANDESIKHTENELNDNQAKAKKIKNEIEKRQSEADEKQKKIREMENKIKEHFPKSYDDIYKEFVDTDFDEKKEKAFRARIENQFTIKIHVVKQ